MTIIAEKMPQPTQTNPNSIPYKLTLPNVVKKIDGTTVDIGKQEIVSKEELEVQKSSLQESLTLVNAKLAAIAALG